MADAPGFDARHEALLREAQQRTRAQVVGHALGVLDPGIDLTGLTYAEVLELLREACVTEMQRLGAA